MAEKKGALERHFSTSDAGEGGGQIGLCLLHGLLGWLRSSQISSPARLSKGSTNEHRKKSSLGEKEKQALGRRVKSGPELLSKGSWHIGEEALRRYRQLEKS